MYMTEIDKHCLLDAFKTRNINSAATKSFPDKATPFFSDGRQSKWIAGIGAVALFAFIQLASFTYLTSQHTHSEFTSGEQIHRVEIDGKRMTKQEKLDYDLAPAQIARVEIVGHRT